MTRMSVQYSIIREMQRGPNTEWTLDEIATAIDRERRQLHNAINRLASTTSVRPAMIELVLTVPQAVYRLTPEGKMWDGQGLKTWQQDQTFRANRGLTKVERDHERHENARRRAKRTRQQIPNTGIVRRYWLSTGYVVHIRCYTNGGIDSADAEYGAHNLVPEGLYIPHTPGRDPIQLADLVRERGINNPSRV